MGSTRRDLPDPDVDLHRHVAGDGIALTQLAGRVQAHAEELPVGLEKKAVACPGGGGDDVVRDLNRRGPISVTAVAELPGVVVAHPPKAAVVFHEKAVPCAIRRDRNRGDAIGDFHRIETRRGGAITQLPGPIVSHAPEGAV